MHYLSPEHWSPRFDSNFFTTEIISWTSLAAPPFVDTATADNTSGCGKSGRFPAIYYTIEIRFGHNRIQVMRRFSEFLYLHHQLIHTISRDDKVQGLANYDIHITAPKKLCPFSVLTDEILDSRQESLDVFLRDVLRRPNMTLHPAVVSFLALDQCQMK
jgi:hypothetical protein